MKDRQIDRKTEEISKSNWLYLELEKAANFH